MSTAGSDPSAPAPPPPPTTGEAPPPRVRIFRWRAIAFLALALALFALGYWLFIDRIVESTIEETGTKALGTAVEVSGLDLHTLKFGVNVGAVHIADPFDRMKDLVSAKNITVALDPDALTEKKIVVRRIQVLDLSFETPRKQPAPVVSGGGFAPTALTAIRKWAAQYRKPILSFTPVDTIRAIALDPAKLASVQAANALRARADSLKTATEQGLQGLAIPQTIDSAQALIQRLKGANVRTLGIDGTRRAVADVKRTIDQVNAAKKRVEGFARTTKDGVALLGTGLKGLDAARQQDYAFARSLLKLPSFSGPAISTALFGPVSVDRVQQAMYWASVARQYMPPGLLPREKPGPKRLRMAGTTVAFPRVDRAYPAFAIESGRLTFTLPGVRTAAAKYDVQVSDISSAPAITGRPTRFSIAPLGNVAGALGFRAAGVLDHRGRTPRDSVSASAQSLPLPSFGLPVLPVRVNPRRGGLQLAVSLVGDSVDARWAIQSDSVQWVPDSAKLASLSPAESIIWRVLSGLSSLELSARAAGPLTAPRLSVRSNLDRALGDRLKSLMGEQIAKAEARARAAVDSIVNERVAPIRAQVASVQAQAQQRVSDARTQLDKEKQALDAQLKQLTGLGGLIKP